LTRRAFATGGLAALAFPLGARAQQAGKVAKLGFLGPARNDPAPIAFYQAFLTQLAANGFRQDQNIAIEYQAIENPRGAFASATELLRKQPDLLVASGPEVGLQALLGASGYVPLVMIAVNYDPIARGYVQSLSRPGGNITGVVARPLELATKQLELLTQAFPDRRRLAVLYEDQSADQFIAAEQTAKSLNLPTHALKLESASYDFEAAFRSAAANDAQFALILSGPAFTQHRQRIAELAIKHGLPTMFTFKHYTEAGGLMSYGVEFPLMWRRAADYVAKILNGAKPADLPIEQAAKFELVVNLKTAKTLGVTIPTGILLRADHVIE
jgi:putative ABC transport system substrate-binding protein